MRLLRKLEMTKRYAHLSPDYKQHAVDALGKRMDTFWILEPNGKMEEKTGSPEHIDNQLVV